MNFFDALNVHLAWKQRLREYLEGRSGEQLDPAVVGREDCCELGRWIASQQDTKQHLPEFMNMREQHAAFHRCAGAIVQRVHAGDGEGAEHVFLTEYAQLSARVIKSITKLNRVLESDHVHEAA
jgi:hypothetical protein